MEFQFALMLGDPASGFVLWGPFEDHDAAEQFATRELDAKCAWWIVRLNNPEKA